MIRFILWGGEGGEAIPILLDCLVSLLETNVSLQSMTLTKFNLLKTNVSLLENVPIKLVI